MNKNIPNNDNKDIKLANIKDNILNIKHSTIYLKLISNVISLIITD
jgi:hypothetical protein